MNPPVDVKSKNLDPPPQLSVIIPCLNEEKCVPLLLEQLKTIKTPHEIIVSDGGSTDNTIQLAKEFRVNVINAPRGRAQQMNLAAQIAQGEYFLFLHADSQLTSAHQIDKALEDFKNILKRQKNHHQAGHFALKFVTETHHHNLAFRYMEEKTSFNRTHTTNGDQGLLLHRKFFAELDGFDGSLGFLEDQIIAEKIRRIGQWHTLPGYLRTSARRFETQGHHRLYIFMGFIMGLYSTGYLEFFKRAPALYRQQRDTGKLKLWPFFALTWKINIEKGFLFSLKAWYRVGRYIRQNSWQMFYFFDQLLRPIYGQKVYPLLKFHDKVFYPITNNRICDGINTIFSFIWFGLVLPFYFLLKDGEGTHLATSQSVPSEES